MNEGLIYIALGFALGGILKGATGAGAPILAIPLMAIFYNVPFAVAVFVVPTLAANLWQVWKYRAQILPAEFSLRFSGLGAIGAGFGTLALATFSSEFLKLVVAGAVIIYVSFRILNPGWKLSYERGLALSAPIGGIAGILQGASGVSAPGFDHLPECDAVATRNIHANHIGVLSCNCRCSGPDVISIWLSDMGTILAQLCCDRRSAGVHAVGSSARQTNFERNIRPGHSDSSDIVGLSFDI